MKKFLTMMSMALVAISLTSCEYDDSELWSVVTDLQEQVAQNTEDIATLSALLEAQSEGKLIASTSESEEGILLTFTDGSTILIKHGEKGTDGRDGKDGANGKDGEDGKDGANGQDGKDGKDGTNGQDGKDGADGKDGDSLFVSVEETDSTVVITLTDGRVITLPKATEGGEGPAYELRTLSFEDADSQFTAYELGYCGATIESWNDLIAQDQYMDTLIYDMSGSEPYYWYDEGNTELMHAFPYNYGSYAYWGGGHAVSNYASFDYETYGDYNNQLTVHGEEGAGGHNGSTNFCMHFGYADDSGYNYTEELPILLFGDGVARVIDHMWVNNSNYALNCYYNGNGLTDPIGESDRVWVIAKGFNENDEQVGESTFYLVDGPEGIITEWTKWDLSSLGEVLYVEFNMGGSNDNGYGFSQPAYFAYDDVAVRF